MIALYMFTVKSVHVHQIDFLRHMQKDGNDIKNLFHEGLEGNKLPCHFFYKKEIIVLISYMANTLLKDRPVEKQFFSALS